ncbi:MAG: tetratricopeptide repeat protein [Xanthobacteraceae bacterium]|nr:tetratricopeptide repeat protein [Xanthobacteraceae bacterium]
MALPGQPPAHLMQTIGQAVALHQQGRLEEAEKLYARALKLQRDNFDALHLFGVLNHQRGKAGEAHRLIAAALKVNPNSPDALSNLGMVLNTLKRGPEALAALDKALALAPGHLDALNNRGNVLLDLKRPEEAVSAFDAVLAAAPGHPQARINRGNALTELGRIDDALADYDAALAAVPNHPLAHYNRGNALRLLGREPEAIVAYERALSAAPDHVNAWLNRGHALAALNRHQDAIASYDRVLALQGDHADAHFNAAMSRLTVGDYARGFQEYEWRWKRTGMAGRKEFRKPPWLGDTPLHGKTIVLHAEQGLGDTVQFARYVPQIARMGARVVLEVPPELKTLLDGLDGAAGIVARGDKLPTYDLHCPLGSLPLACKTDAANIPAAIPYLRAPEAHLAKWRARLERLPSPRVALAWSGRAAHPNDKNRSVSLAQLKPLLSAPGMSFVSVQRELRDDDAGLLSREPRIAHVGAELDDFADTAAVLTLCDLLVCVDTSVAHVAGALGRPVALLVPFQPDWRWMLDREASPWYPSIRLFRQSAPRDWDGVIARVRDALPQAAS